MVRDIYITGNEKYIDDFLYLFPSLNAQRTFCLEEIQASEEHPIVMCYPKEKGVETMEWRGLQYRKDFFYASDYIEHWVAYELEERARGKSIALWGGGKTARLFFPFINDLQIDCVIDSAVDSNNTASWNGLRLVNPNILDIFFWETHYIFVTSVFYDEIKENLMNHGLREFEDFISFRAFPIHLTKKIIDSIEGEARSSFVCPLAGKTKAMFVDGSLYPCIAFGWSDPIGNVLYDTTNHIYNSLLNRAFTISFKNRVNSFCDPDQCEFIFNSSIYRKEKCDEILPYMPSRIAGAAYDDSCNLYCSTCRSEVRWGTTKEKDKLHEIFVRDILLKSEMLYAAGNGEVFASRYYQMLLSESNLRNIKYLLVHTNGVLATEEKVKSLCQLVQGMGVVISVDAVSEKTYHIIRRGGDFKKLYFNIEKIGNLRKQRVLKAFGLIFVVSKINYLEMVDFVKKAEEYHVDAIIFIKVDNWGMWTEEEFRELQMTDANRIPKKELEVEIQKLKKLQSKCKVYYDKEWLFLRDMLLGIRQ